jgi:hypothetical protein
MRFCSGAGSRASDLARSRDEIGKRRQIDLALMVPARLSFG